MTKLPQTYFIEKVNGVQVRTPHHLFVQLKKAQEQDPDISCYFVCGYCYAYVPENHAETAQWLQAHRDPNDNTSRKHHPHFVYRCLDPEKFIPSPAVASSLSPAEQLAEALRSRAS